MTLVQQKRDDAIVRAIAKVIVRAVTMLPAASVMKMVANSIFIGGYPVFRTRFYSRIISFLLTVLYLAMTALGVTVGETENILSRGFKPKTMILKELLAL